MQTKAPQVALRRVAENLYRRESSGVYYALAKSGGKQIRRSLKTADRVLANRRLREFLQDVSGLATKEAGHITFDALAKRWQATLAHAGKGSTDKRRGQFIKALSPFFAGCTLRNVTPARCEAWALRRGVTLAPQTFAHELETMKAIFNYARAQGLIIRNPAEGIRRKRIVHARVAIPSREQFAKLVAAIRESDGRPDSQAKARDGADLVELLAYSGCRLDEARNLRWQDVAFDRGTLAITGGEQRTKNYEARTVPMTQALSGLLFRLHAERQPQPTDYIALTKNAKKCLETACRRLAFPHFTHHALRHFFATTAIESGGDISTVAKMLGHKDGGALLMKTYGHLRQEHAFTVARQIHFGTEAPANVLTLQGAGAAS
jgi:integrase